MNKTIKHILFSVNTFCLGPFLKKNVPLTQVSPNHYCFRHNNFNTFSYVLYLLSCVRILTPNKMDGVCVKRKYIYLYMCTFLSFRLLVIKDYISFLKYLGIFHVTLISKRPLSLSLSHSFSIKHPHPRTHARTTAHTHTPDFELPGRG